MKYVCSKDVICGPGSGMLETHLKEGKIPKEYDTIDSGAVAVLFMSLQSKIEKNLKSNFWILNILIDVIGYFIYTYLVFILFFS